MRIPLLGLALIGLVACGSETTVAEAPRTSATALQAQPAAFSVQFEKKYGFCRGDCYLSLSVDSEGAAMAEVVSTDGKRRSRQFTLTAAELAFVRAGVEAAMAEPWDARYGCPDCVDQGAWTLQIAQDGEVRRAEVDPKAQPPHLAPLLERLDALEQANRP